MFGTFSSRFEVHGVLDTVTAIRIGAGRSTSPASPDLPVVRDVLGQPYIPGSSFKGVLRSYVESLLRSLTSCNQVVCNPTIEKQLCITSAQMNSLRDQRKKREWSDQQFAEEVLGRTCWVCQLFGSPWYASRLQIRDLTVKPGTWFDQYQQRDGVAIDRDTETARGGMLYDYEVVPAGVSFDFHAIVDNAEEWQLGMLYVGLAGFEQERLTLGGGVSRGLGLVKLSLHKEHLLKAIDLKRWLAEPEYPGELADREQWVAAFRQRIEELSSQQRETGGNDA